jgi:glutamate N-acetyltransferase / amino-acid N-acetyltransferase
MAVNLTAPKILLPVTGIRLGTAEAGIRRRDRKDLVVIACEPPVNAAAVFTRNRFCAAPVRIARRHLSQTEVRALLINTGYANAGTDPYGEADAEACIKVLAEHLSCPPQRILPFSTGIIGERLPIDRITQAIPDCLKALKEEAWSDAAAGIMTTDTVAKGCSRQVSIGRKTVTLTGIAKGAGMIRPDMATMLAFIATDAAIDPTLAQACLQEAVTDSFNRITVDGDTSTNDACVLLTSGRAANPPIIDRDDPSYAIFADSLTEVCTHLAQSVVRDGEGATKFITIEVTGADSERSAQTVAYTVAHSPLVKTAFTASDPNWGRILAAVGRAPITNLNLDKLEIFFDDLCIIRRGMMAEEYTEAKGKEVMQQAEITVRIRLGTGEVGVTVWTCDLSHDYVSINADYRS